MVTITLEEDELAAMMQCASVGATAAQALLGANARPMQPIFIKVQEQYSEQQPMLAQPRTGNGKTAVT